MLLSQCVNTVNADACDAAKRRDASVPCEWARTIYPTMTLDASGVNVPDRTRTAAAAAASKQQIVCSFSLSCITPVLLHACQLLLHLGGSCLVCA